MRDQRGDRLDRAHLTCRVRGVETVDRRIDHEIVQRPRIGDQRAHRFVAAFDAQIARIEVVFGDRDERLRRERGVQTERVDRGLLPSRIAVECEHDTRAQRLPLHLQGANQLHGAQRIVRDQSADDLRMLGAECGAARGDRRVDAGQMHGHHIGIAFDDHRLAFLHNRRFGKVDAVQHLCFAVQLRVGRVDVFRVDRVILVQLARAEAKRTSGRITNRPCHAATEIVVYATLALTGESRVEHLLLGEAFAGKVPHQVIPSLGGISAAEPLAVGLAEVATVQQLARGERLLGHQLGDEVFLRRLVGFE